MGKSQSARITFMLSEVYLPALLRSGDAFAYSLFVSIYSLISTMAGFSYSRPSIKLVHWSVAELHVLH